jgi:transposase-like protein
VDSEISPQKDIIKKRNRISEFMVDETAIKAGSECIWLWGAIEPKDRQTLALSISKKRRKFVAEVYRRFGQESWKTSGFHRWGDMVSTSMPNLETTASHSFTL